MTIRVEEAIDAAIGNEESSWHEYDFENALRKFAGFSPIHWTVLAEIALSRPAYWQERCAEVVGESGDDRAVGILLELLRSPHVQVASIVASELDNLEVVLSKEELPILTWISEHLERRLSPRREDVKRLIARIDK